MDLPLLKKYGPNPDLTQVARDAHAQGRIAANVETARFARTKALQIQEMYVLTGDRLLWGASEALLELADGLMARD